LVDCELGQYTASVSPLGLSRVLYPVSWPAGPRMARGMGVLAAAPGGIMINPGSTVGAALYPAWAACSSAGGFTGAAYAMVPQKLPARGEDVILGWRLASCS
jgi:hypothetical protein